VAIMSTSEADPASRKSGQGNGQPVREPGPAGAVPIKGIDARLVANMTASLGIPSATSFRAIPVEILVALARPLNPAPTTTTRGGIVRCESDDGVGELVRHGRLRPLTWYPSRAWRDADTTFGAHRLRSAG
jgi:hypothetical protein